MIRKCSPSIIKNKYKHKVQKGNNLLEGFVVFNSTLKNGKKGFTLVEIMIVLVILGLLIAVALPKVTQVLSTGKVNATKASMASLAKAMKNFNADTSVWPANVQDLIVPINATTGSCYHSKTLDTLTNYSAAQVKSWKGPYMDGTTTEISVDAWNAKVAIGVVGAAPNYAYSGKDSAGTAVTFAAKDCKAFGELGGVPGLYIHSPGDDTATGAATTAQDDLMVFVSSKQ